MKVLLPSAAIIDINAAGADLFNRQQTHELNVRWNTVYRTMHNFSSWESVKGFISRLSKLSLPCILKLHYEFILAVF